MAEKRSCGKEEAALLSPFHHIQVEYQSPVTTQKGQLLAIVIGSRHAATSSRPPTPWNVYFTVIKAIIHY